MGRLPLAAASAVVPTVPAPPPLHCAARPQGMHPRDLPPRCQPAPVSCRCVKCQTWIGFDPATGEPINTYMLRKDGVCVMCESEVCSRCNPDKPSQCLECTVGAPRQMASKTRQQHCLCKVHLCRCTMPLLHPPLPGSADIPALLPGSHYTHPRGWVHPPTWVGAPTHPSDHCPPIFPPAPPPTHPPTHSRPEMRWDTQCTSRTASASRARPVRARRWVTPRGASAAPTRVGAAWSAPRVRSSVALAALLIALPARRARTAASSARATSEPACTRRHACIVVEAAILPLVAAVVVLCVGLPPPCLLLCLCLHILHSLHSLHAAAAHAVQQPSAKAPC